MKARNKTGAAASAARVRESLALCGPDGSQTLQLLDDGGRPSSSGRTHRIQVRVLGTIEGRPVTLWHITHNVAEALGMRMTRDQESILMGGYGYSRTLELAMRLSELCGHELHCESPGSFAGANGWVRSRS
jgi:hypothetical protein